ncbi:general transcription and DNA repair factor IIH subunit TFB4 isoform X2 [Cajanus cajan]|uniref:general transcription and DNA repair factor IIH subunit TFB4 isoform X2 n=1 Tax=Cajanus cajan TaxID=3821 RepID=UPI00098DC3C0|nr:general transcription and DNA repair factor IIH subunit TFB4 isoform X2 [Cajanus cajan]
MTSAPSKLYADDVSLLVVTLDTNPFFWSTFPFPFADFLSQVLAFLNSILLLGQLNQVIVIATGCNSCGYVFDSTSDKNHGSTTGTMPALYSNLLHNLDQFVARDQQLASPHTPGTVPSSLLSGSLSMALCYIQRAFRSGPMPPQPRILCLQGATDGPEQYVAIMNAIFSAQHSVVPIDSCYIGSNNSAFLQQASYITGGIYYKPPQLDGLYQYLSCLQLICIHVHFYGFLNPWVWIFVPRASAISKQLTWAMYVLCAYPYSASIMISVQPVGLYLARLN